MGMSFYMAPLGFEFEVRLVFIFVFFSVFYFRFFLSVAPVSSSAPSLTNKEKFKGYDASSKSAFSLFCEAHGYPIPRFRYTR